MAVAIAIETPLQDDVRELVAALNAHLLPLSPVEFQFKMTVEQMAGPETTLFVARDEKGFAPMGSNAQQSGEWSPALSGDEMRTQFANMMAGGTMNVRLTEPVPISAESTVKVDLNYLGPNTKDMFNAAVAARSVIKGPANASAPAQSNSPGIKP